VRDTLNLIHELAERGVGVRNLADPIRVDSSNPSDPMAQLAVVLLALFGQMERTYTLERAAHAAPSRPPKAAGSAGRSVDRAKLDYAAHLRAAGHTVAEIVTKTGIPPAPASTDTCRPGPPSRSPRASCPSQPSADPPDGVPHSAASVRESSPNQAHGTLITADTD